MEPFARHQNFNRSRTGADVFLGNDDEDVVVFGVADRDRRGDLERASSSGTVFEWPTTSARSCGFRAASRDASAWHVGGRQLLRRQAQRVGQRLGRLDGAPQVGGEDVGDAGLAQHVSQPVRAADAVGRERRVGRLIEPLGMPHDVDGLLRAAHSAPGRAATMKAWRRSAARFTDATIQSSP